MKIIATTLLLFYAVLLAACSGVTSHPPTSMIFPTIGNLTTTSLTNITTMPVPTIGNLTATSLITITAIPTPTSTPRDPPTPETVYGFPTSEPAIWPTCRPIADCLQLTPNVQRKDFSFHELYLGKYVLRNWCNVDRQFTFWSICAVTISSKGSKQVEIWGYPDEFGKETGADLTGRGKPDIVIINWSGGNCCVEAEVYEAGDNLKKIMDVSSHLLGTFTDLNGDGAYEYIAVDRIWSQFCDDCTVWTTVVYEYHPKNFGYLPATYKFKDVLSADIHKDLDFLNQFTQHNPNIPLYFDTDADSKNMYWQYAKGNSEYDSAVNAVYSLTAYYLMAGQQSDAQNILNKYFPPGKAVEYMLGIQKDLQGLLAP